MESEIPLQAINNKPYVDASRTKQTTETITQKLAKQNTRKTDNTMLPSSGRVSSTNASGSKPKSNTKNDRIPQPSSKSMKNKVEAHHRKFKPSGNKNNRVSDCKANIKNVALSKNSNTICLSCNECLFSANHDACVVQYLKKIQKRKVAKSAKLKCPKLSLRYANARESLSKCMINLDFHPFNLHDFRFEGIIWDEELPPWKFDLGLGHNLFCIRQFCDSDLEVAFRKHTCFVRNLEGVDLLSGSRGSNLYTISMADMMNSSPIFERRNRTLVEAARTMLIFSKSLLFLWAEAVATACYTQNRSLIHTRYSKTPYELLRDCKPELKYLYFFGALCYPTNDFKDLGKPQPKANIRIFIGYSPS
ncbi:integrase, catalytic region, zinc finger, CCHC-type containing protein [Tanacetum coccineum]